MKTTIIEQLEEIRSRWMKRKSNRDGGPGSGNFGHEGRPGKRGGSAKSIGSSKAGLSAPTWKEFNGSGEFEVTGEVSDMYLTSSAKDRAISASKAIESANDLRRYLKRKNIDLVVDYEPLKARMGDEIKSVKKQADYIVAAIEQYEELGGLDALKAVHIYDPGLDAQAQYSYRAKGEGEVSDEGHIYFSDRADGFHIMHEFAHAYADSHKPKDMDVVEWSSKLCEKAGLAKEQNAYFGAESSVYEAERFADAFGHALCYGQGKTERLKFVANVARIITETKGK